MHSFFEWLTFFLPYFLTEEHVCASNVPNSNLNAFFDSGQFSGPSFVRASLLQNITVQSCLKFVSGVSKGKG